MYGFSLAFRVCSLGPLFTSFSGLRSDVKSSRTSWPRGQIFGLGLGLGLEDLSSASASSIWPRPVLELFILASWKCFCLYLLRLQVELAKSAQQTNQEVSRASGVAAEPPTKKRTGLFSHYRTATASQSPSATCLRSASQQIHSHQQWSIRSSSWIFSPGQTCTRLPSSATTLLSHVLCAS